MLAAQAPWYEPGSAPAYQILDHGHLLDGVVRAATGRALADVLRDDVVAPLGGRASTSACPTTRSPHCADLIPPPPSQLDYSTLPPDHFLIRTAINPILTHRHAATTPPWRQSAVGGAGGHGNARGIAQVQALVSHGGEVGGVRLLSPETIDRIFEVQASGPDLVLMAPLTYGIGYALPTPSAPAIPSGRTCWWTGYGGAIVVNDLDRRTTVAYARTRCRPHGRLAAHRRLRAHRLRVPGEAVNAPTTTPHVCIIGAGCSGITTAKRLKEFGDRLRPVRAERRRRRQLVLPEPQRPLGRLRVAAHRHLDARACSSRTSRRRPTTPTSRTTR